MGLSRIPMPGLPGASLSENSANWMQRMLQKKQAEDQLAQEALAQQQLNKYRQQQFGLEQQKLLGEQALKPLKMDLLKAQIENQKSLAKSREGKDKVVAGLTKANVTKNQNIIQSIDNVIPLLNNLKDSEFPGQTVGKFFHPSQQANYQAKISALTDSLVASLGLPKTNESLALIKKMVEQQFGESKASYKKRLMDVISDLTERKKRATTNIAKGISGLNNEEGDQYLAEDADGNLVEA